MKQLLALFLLGLVPVTAGCGGEPEAIRTPVSAPAERTVALSTPPPAMAPGTLAAISDSEAAQHRIGYVDLEAVDAFGGTLGSSEITRAVLGASAAAHLADADATGVRTAVSIGSSLVLDGAGRQVFGAGAARKELASTTPERGLLAEETPSAVQSGLGDSVAEVIVGPAVLGDRASIGASLLRSGDGPAGRQLLISAAPHFHRELELIRRKLAARFPGKGLAKSERPVITFEEIGEREIVRAVVREDQVAPALLRELLSGGTTLADLGRE